MFHSARAFCGWGGGWVRGSSQREEEKESFSSQQQQPREHSRKGRKGKNEEKGEEIHSWLYCGSVASWDVFLIILAVNVYFWVLTTS